MKYSIASLGAVMALTAVCYAQSVPQPPELAPPAASAVLEDRTAWCDPYVEWVLSKATPEEAPPEEERATRRAEVERNSCVLDPVEYERLTRAELGSAHSR